MPDDKNPTPNEPEAVSPEISMLSKIKVLYEDPNILAINKPSGIWCTRTITARLKQLLIYL